VVTAASLDSVACRAERQYAVALAKVVVPVRFEATSADLAPGNLQRRQWVDYLSGDKSAAFALVRALHMAESGQLPDPLPAPPPLPLTYIAELRRELDSSSPRTLDQQLRIVFQVRERLRAGGEADSIGQLLRWFRQGDDLLARVATEVDGLIAEAETVADTRSRGGAASSPTPRLGLGVPAAGTRPDQRRQRPRRMVLPVRRWLARAGPRSPQSDASAETRRDRPTWPQSAGRNREGRLDRRERSQPSNRNCDLNACRDRGRGQPGNDEARNAHASRERGVVCRSS
jgi:hypothetical protein